MMDITTQNKIRHLFHRHKAQLGCAEIKKRGKLVDEAQGLINRLGRRLMDSARVADRDAMNRVYKTLLRAACRADRRETAYYGGGQER